MRRLNLAFYLIRDENRAKFKFSYSCGHRVSKSARYLNLNLNSLLVTRQMTLFHQGVRMGGGN